MDTPKYIAQKDGTWCFVCALANCAIHFGREIPDIEGAKKIARCNSGATICHSEVIEYFLLPLVPVSDAVEVLKRGGIITIMHPIYNGHSFFVFPDSGTSVMMVDSWLGPLVAKGVGHAELLQFVRGNLCGYHWVIADSILHK